MSYLQTGDKGEAIDGLEPLGTPLPIYPSDQLGSGLNGINITNLSGKKKGSMCLSEELDGSLVIRIAQGSSATSIWTSPDNADSIYPNPFG